MPLGSRPPPLPKGVPHPYNSISRPKGPPPKPGLVWSQGKWRGPNSKSGKYLQQKNSSRLKKALRLPYHGKTIYAYSNLRTKQVVYSLTRVMNNARALSQLLYHGKKTRPAALRRDMWTPYYSVQFPSTRVGQLAYAHLRELNLLHQLCPKESSLIATEEHIKAWEDRVGKEVADDEEYDLIGNTKQRPRPRPLLGQKLPKKERAKMLMNQKASSVADLAFTLGLAAEAPGREEEERIVVERRVSRFEELGQKAQRRALERIIELKKARDRFQKLRTDYFRGRVEGRVKASRDNRGEIEAGVKRARLRGLLEKRTAERNNLARTLEALEQKGVQDYDPLKLCSDSPKNVIASAVSQMAQITKNNTDYIIHTTDQSFKPEQSPSLFQSREANRAYHFVSTFAQTHNITNRPHRDWSPAEAMIHLFGLPTASTDTSRPSTLNTDNNNDDLLMTPEIGNLRSRYSTLNAAAIHTHTYDLPYAQQALEEADVGLVRLQNQIDEVDARLNDGTYVALERGKASKSTGEEGALSRTQGSLQTIERAPLPDGAVLVLWSDMNDARYVSPRTWPVNVAHGELERGPKVGRSIHVIGDAAKGEEGEREKEKGTVGAGVGDRDREKRRFMDEEKAKRTSEEDGANRREVEAEAEGESKKGVWERLRERVAGWLPGQGRGVTVV
ncbi:MAG: hypothetical protein Q9160_003490 [Pyrenula sp. 1 TL-2023]